MENSSSLPSMVIGIFSTLMWLMCLFIILKPQIVAESTSKWFKRILKAYGYNAEIKLTSKAIAIVRIWNLFMLIVFSILIFLSMSGKIKP